MPPADLSGMQLAYAWQEARGGELLGSPTSGFAFYSNEMDTLVIVSEDQKKIMHATLEDWIGFVAMDIAKDRQATFIAHGDAVICSIHGFSESGDSYGEAAMRALLAQQRAERATEIASC